MNIKNLFSKIKKLSCGPTLLLAAALPSAAQLFPDRGFLPGAPITSSDTDDVNLRNRNMIYQVPIYKFPPGPGGMSFDYTLVYNSAIYDSIPTVRILQSGTGGGWRASVLYSLTSEAGASGCFSGSVRVSVIFPDSSQHLLHLKGKVGDPPGTHYQSDANGFYNAGPDGVGYCGQATLSGRLVYYTDDGKYTRMEIDTATQNWTLYLPNGTSVEGAGVPGDCNKITDRNGNFITIGFDTNQSSGLKFVSEKTIHLSTCSGESNA